jgi:putative methanogenesis marker protein 6
MSEERETRLLMISPASNITPDQLSRTIHAMGKQVTVKETCYGCLIEGPRPVVIEVRDSVRKLDPNGIFSKIRAYPASDPRRCRAQHGTRPGFAQLEMEWKALSVVQAGLDAADRGEKINEPPKKKQLSVDKFKEICEVD